MTNPYDLMIQGKHYKDVLKAAVNFSNEELLSASHALHEQQVVEVAVYTSSTCLTLGIQQTFVTGGLLHLFSIVAETDGRQEYLENLLDDLAISRTQAYRCLAAWRCFGATLIAEPQLGRCFVSESLKILSSDSVSSAARDEALERARQEERISIKVAEALVAKHDDQANASRSISNPQPARAKRRLLYAGKVVRVQLNPRVVPETADVVSMIRDLEAAIVEVKNQFSPSNAPLSV